jgi:hypothetical protein
MTAIVRAPVLAVAWIVERLRRLPGAQSVTPLLPWTVRLLVAGAILLGLLWMAEASPQRITLRQLAAGELSHMQSWVIVDGELKEEPGSTPAAYRYRLTDPATPNTRLDVRSEVPWPLGRTTVSGRVVGGRDGVPEGYEWSAILRADPQLANELPPPWAAFAMAALALAILAARRTTYPMFVTEQPSDVPPSRHAVRVVAHGDRGASQRPDRAGILDLDTHTALAELRIMGERPVDVRLHSAFTSIDVGVRHGLGWSEPGLRVRAADDDLILGFENRRERDGAFATLALGAQPRAGAQAPGGAHARGGAQAPGGAQPRGGP